MSRCQSNHRDFVPRNNRKWMVFRAVRRKIPHFREAGDELLSKADPSVFA